MNNNASNHGFIKPVQSSPSAPRSFAESSSQAVGGSLAHAQNMGTGDQIATGRDTGEALACLVPQGLVFVENGTPVTTSLAIADGTQVEHRAVLQLVRTYEADLAEFGRVAFEMRPFDTAGGTQNREVALLNEQQAALIMSYMKNSETVRSFKKGLIKAFFAMAEQLRAGRPVNPMAVLNDPAAMRGLLLNYTEKVIALEGVVAEKQAVITQQTPKVAAFEMLQGADGSLCVRDACKLIKCSEKWLYGWLSQSRWIYRRPGRGNWLAYSDPLTRGLLDHKIHITTGMDGERIEHPQLRITAKGIAYIAKQLVTQMADTSSAVMADLDAGQEAST